MRPISSCTLAIITLSHVTGCSDLRSAPPADGGISADHVPSADVTFDGGLDASTSDFLPHDVAAEAVDETTIDAAPASVPDAPPSDVTLDVATAVIACPSPIAPPAVADFTCGFGTCGNGAVEMTVHCGACPMDLFCQWRPRNDRGACCYETGERCDGADLGGATCASLGYAGGALACASWCGFDTSACDACAADPRLPSCRAAPVAAAGIAALSVAARGDELGVAWLAGATADGRSGLHFARFDASANLVAESGCFGTTAYLAATSTHVAPAPTPTGWVVAINDYDRASGEGWVELYQLDADGSHATLAQRVDGPSWFGRMLARPAAGPIFFWMGMSAQPRRPAPWCARWRCGPTGARSGTSPRPTGCSPTSTTTTARSRATASSWRRGRNAAW